MCTITWRAFEGCKHVDPDANGNGNVQFCDGVMRSGSKSEPERGGTCHDYDDTGRHYYRYEPKTTKKGYCGQCRRLVNIFAGELGSTDVGSPSTTAAVPADQNFWDELGFLPTAELVHINMFSINWHLLAASRDAGPAHRGDTFIVHRILEVQLIKACVERLLLRKAFYEKWPLKSPWTALRKSQGLRPLVHRLLEVLLSSLGRGLFNQFDYHDVDLILRKAFDNLKDRTWRLLHRTEEEVRIIFATDLDRQIQRMENGNLAMERLRDVTTLLGLD